MTSILSNIWCWLSSFWYSLRGFVNNSFDSLLSGVDALVSGVANVGSLAAPVFDSQYMWVAGAVGLPQALAIVAGALLIRFVLQTIPFVRWGS
jgi:hypothetical protein